SGSRDRDRGGPGRGDDHGRGVRRARGGDPRPRPPGRRHGDVRNVPGRAVPRPSGPRRGPVPDRRGRGLSADGAAHAGEGPGAEAVSVRTRLALFGVGAAAALALVVWGLSGIPGFGHYGGSYGYVLN